MKLRLPTQSEFITGSCLLLAYAFGERWWLTFSSWILLVVLIIALENAYKLYVFKKENLGYLSRFKEISREFSVSLSIVRKRSREIIYYSPFWNSKELRGDYDFYGLLVKRIIEKDAPDKKWLADQKYPLLKTRLERGSTS